MFEFVIPGIPRTIQTKRAATREEWKRKVAQAATEALAGQGFYLHASCSATVIYFYSATTELDVDGIAKLILDSLQRIIFDDDSIVEQVLTRKSDQVGLALSNPPVVLADALGRLPNLVYVKINRGPNHSELPL
jgi:crossover junction endodeoxyribonuclease RusA